jgi:uncharacterized protein (DUF433 family)
MSRAKRILAGSLLARITISPDICHGKPVIRNLRYPVESMLEYLAGGDTIEDLLAEFPNLEREDLLACLEFAAASLRLKTQHFALAGGKEGARASCYDLARDLAGKVKGLRKDLTTNPAYLKGFGR